MIVVRLMGGLGNQLFQYAAARRLALERNVGLSLDLGWLQYEAGNFATPRSYELAPFELPANLISLRPATVARLEDGLYARLGRWPARPVRLPVLRERSGGTGLDARLFDAPETALLIGYWQSERYFADRAEPVRAELRPAPLEDNGWREALEMIKSSNSVAVHVRRGDYVTVPAANDTHGTLSTNYYRDAMNLVCERVPAASHAFLFSDDPQWTSNNLAFPIATTYVSLNGWTSTAELGLMAACRHHVIANSSFSWWGAWLAEHPEQVVVAPKAWFRNPARNQGEIVPQRWLRI